MSRSEPTEGERFAPWLVLMSQHLPVTRVTGDGIRCSCGSLMYVGHLPRLLADRADELAVRAATTDRNARAGIENGESV